jgi:hypothetical protein
MTYWVLTKSGRIIARSTNQHITMTDMQQEAIRQLMEVFDMSITARFADEHFVLLEPGLFYLDDDLEPTEPEDDPNMPMDAEYGDMIQEACPDVDVEIYDRYLNAEVILERDGEPVRARVAKRARVETGAPIGRSHTNPLFDTREYDCIFDDGTVERYTANIIVENLYSQCDSDGHSFLVLKEIIDHTKDNSTIPIFNGNRVPKKTTRGWKLHANGKTNRRVGFHWLN